jgi:hypothetical protein
MLLTDQIIGTFYFLIKSRVIYNWEIFWELIELSLTYHEIIDH